MFLGRKVQAGIALSDGILYGLLVAVLVLGCFAVFRSVDAQQQVATAFKGWYEDHKGHEKALKQQATLHKPILVYIYASWCPHCKEFSAKVLSNREVQKFVNQYPHVRVAPDNGKAEKKIMEAYGAEGYPSFYVVTPDGKRHTVETFVTSPEPRQKTPAEFIESLQAIIQKS